MEYKTFLAKYREKYGTDANALESYSACKAAFERMLSAQLGEREERFDRQSVDCQACFDDARYSLVKELRETFATYGFPMMRKNSSDLISHLGIVLHKLIGKNSG